jgi:hypothetical protein
VAAEPRDEQLGPARPVTGTAAGSTGPRRSAGTAAPQACGREPAIVITSLIVALALALALLVVGLRGRRVDDHPLCRRCGFDLTGRPDESTRCAECGADLARRRAVRAGHRVRRRWAVRLGTLLLLGAAVPAGVAGWARARGVTWNVHKPTWWLIREGGSRSAPTRDAALAELQARVNDNRLSPGELDAAVDMAVAVQRDAKDGALPVEWMRLIESARATAKLTDEAWNRFWVSPIQPLCSVSAEQVGFEGRGLHVATVLGFPSNLDARRNYAVNWRITDCSLNGHPWDGARVKSRFHWTGGFDRATLAALRGGPVELRMGVRAKLFRDGGGGPPPPPVDVTFELRTTFPFKHPDGAAAAPGEVRAPCAGGDDSALRR